MKAVRALFFDMDGTLADSLPIAYEMYADFAKKMGLKPSLEEFVYLGGMSQQEAVRHLCKKAETALDLQSILQGYMSGFVEKYKTHIKLYAGAREILEKAQALGYRLSLVTAASRDMAHALLEKEDLFHFFEDIVTPEGLTKSKPDPAIYQKALSLAGVDNHEAIAFEDSKVGMLSARGAGLRTVWMNHTEAEDIELQGLFDHAFSDWNSVNTWLEDARK